MLANNIEKYIEEGIWLPKKIIVDLNYLRSEGSIALTLKRNCAKWHKNCTLKIEVTSSRLKRALSNVSKKKRENELPTKMMMGGRGAISPGSKLKTCGFGCYALSCRPEGFFVSLFLDRKRVPHPKCWF